MKFSDLGLSEPILRAVTDAGYTIPTPVQAEAIPIVLTGRDVLACAQTGTGKTASFTLPMLEILGSGRARARMPRSLILEPTRELAAQVAENFDIYGKDQNLSKALLIGGESLADQVKVVERGVDVLIATPGRLLDVFERGHLLLNDTRILVIDEADRMLDMGFIPDVERIAKIVSRMRQTLLFSATMPKEIRRLAETFMSNPKEITVSPPASPAETVRQQLIMVKAGRGAISIQKEKRAALRDLLRGETVRNALVFCNRKRDVGVVCRSLKRHGFNAGQLHGDMQQSARMETLDAFKKGDIHLLVCSDVAARGLDIQDMSHVFNFDVPSHAEDYVHRIGRTGRAGRSGTAYTIATTEDSRYLASIERLIGKKIPTTDPVKTEPTVEAAPASEDAAEEAPPQKKARRSRRKPRDEAAQPSVEAAPESTEDTKPKSKTRTKPDPKQKAETDPQPKAESESKPKARPKAVQKGASTKKSKGEAKPKGKQKEPVRGLGPNVPAFFLLEAKPSRATAKDDEED